MFIDLARRGLLIAYLNSTQKYKFRLIDTYKGLSCPKMKGQSTLSELEQLPSIADLSFVGTFSFIIIISVLATMFSSV